MKYSQKTSFNVKTSKNLVKSGCLQKHLRWRAQTFFKIKEVCKVFCVKIFLWSMVAQKGTNILLVVYVYVCIYVCVVCIFSNMVLNMVLNIVLNLVPNRISSFCDKSDGLRLSSAQLAILHRISSGKQLKQEKKEMDQDSKFNDTLRT